MRRLPNSKEDGSSSDGERLAHDSPLLDANPRLKAEFRRIADAAERHFGAVCMFEFVIQDDALFVTNCRPARLTGRAAIKSALDLFVENVITAAQVLEKITPLDLWSALLPTINPASRLDPIGRGLPASAGVVSGPVIFSAAGAVQMIDKSATFIYVRQEVSPEDLPTIAAAAGLLTLRGGVSSHGALICRHFTKAGVTGLGGNVTSDRRQIVGLKRVIHEYDSVTLNGATGEVYLGEAIVDSVRWQDDPYLRLLQTLIEVLARTDALPSARIGSCWKLRDMLLRGSASNEPEDQRARCRDWPSLPQSRPAWRVFRPMRKPTARHLFAQSHAFACVTDGPDHRLVWQGLRQHLFNLLARHVGIGRHPDFYRPLFDPCETTTAASGELGFEHSQDGGQFQMIGEEFFGLNYWSDDYLRFDSIEIHAVVWCERPENLWRIDATNLNGEKLLVGSNELVSLRVVVNGAVVPRSDLPRFYHYFRMREHRSDFPAGVSPRQFREFLRDWQKGGGKGSPSMKKLARDTDLFDDHGMLTRIGRSALERTDAKARRTRALG